jgi:branched-chain amino acid transport system substrate-binding protein
VTIGIFGPHADALVQSSEMQSSLNALNARGRHYSLVAIPSDASWGKASTELVSAVYERHAIALIALDRPSSHLAEQIAVKSFIPVMAISSDRTLTSTNIPWIFRLPEGTAVSGALGCLAAAIDQVGPNPAEIRLKLASGMSLAGVQFDETGEARR